MQTVKTTNHNRNLHVWYYRARTEDYKCVLCGGIVKDPATLKDSNDILGRYEGITDRERQMCPPTHKR